MWVVKLSKPSNTSAAMPSPVGPPLIQRATIFPMIERDMPPTGRVQMPSWFDLVVFAFASEVFFFVFASLAVMAGLSESGTPCCVRRAGESMVRMPRREYDFSVPVAANGSGSFIARLTAMTASATASSSLEGSKRILLLITVTRRVIGGRGSGVWACVVAPVSEIVEYNLTAASQSSSNSGSSSSTLIRRGSRVSSSARCVVNDNNGKGYESGAERRSICNSTIRFSSVIPQETYINPYPPMP